MSRSQPSLFSRIITSLLGKISWQSPVWLNRIAGSYRAKQRLVNSLILLLIAIVAAGGFYYWRQHQPKPQQVMAVITPPPITPVDKVLEPQPLVIHFGTQVEGHMNPVSVAPLANVGKLVTQGISVKPALAGKWLWESDRQLTFYPQQDWLANQTYAIQFDKSLFAKQHKLGSYTYSFNTLPFTATVDDFKFYQDAQNPKQTQVVATLHFSFPVKAESLQQHTHLILQALKNDKVDLQAKSYAYTFTYDENKRTAYLTSENINPPPTPRYINLIIDKGVAAGQGDGKTAAAISKTLLIPDAGSFLQVAKVASDVVRDNQDRPQQVLTLETSLGTTTADLAQHMQVYLLPQNRPPTQLEPMQKNYTWREPGEVTPEILALAKPITLTALPEEHPFPTLHSWQYSADAPGFLYIKMTKGVQGAGDFTLANDYQTVVPAPEMPKEINFLHNGALISLGSEKKLTVLLRGVPVVKFSVARVLPTEINHLVSQTRGDFQNPDFVSFYFSRDDISEIFSENREFNISSPGELQYTTLDLEQYLTADTAKKPLGLFLIKAQSWNKETNEPSGVENNRLILITDMGLLVKNNSDNTHDVFVQSISQGTPVANAQVLLLGKNGMPIVSGVTNADGHMPLSSVEDYKNQQQPTVYVVRNGDDVTFMPYDRADRQLNFSRFDIGGINDDTQNAVSAFLFSERGIYRPGDLMHIGMIVKQKFATLQPAGLPLEAVITDPRSVTVLDQKMSLPESGLLTLNYRPDTTSATGTYTVSLYLIKDGQRNNLLGSTDVRVEEFLPDRLKAKATFMLANTPAPTAAGWLTPQTLNARLQVNNLFGMPASNRRVTAKIVLAPRAFYFPQYAQYNFTDPLLDPKKPPQVFSEDLADTHTNDQGEAQFALNLQRFAKATYQLTFLTQAFEADGGRGVSTQISTLVTSLAYLVGYKADGDLTYLKKDSQHSVNFIAIQSDLKKIAVTPLQAQILSVKTVATLVKNPNGTYKYQSVKQELPLKDQAFTILDTGSDFNLPTQEIGDYALTLADAQGHIISKVYFSVVGDSGHPVQKNAELTVKLAKKEYNPGDSIEMQITAPYTGAGLITVERDKVYTYKWFKTDTNSSVQTINLPPDFEGNGYINIAYVRDYGSEEIFISPLSYSVIPFNVNRAAHTVNISLDAPKLLKPGEELAVHYSTNIPSQIIVFAVDQGILQVTDFQTPDPLSAFFSKRALGVNTAQIVDQILPKYSMSRELSAIGGDNGDKALASNINPFKRKTEAPVVFWSGILDADATTRTTTYKVPDYFNGAIRVMAVAVAPNAVGSTKTATTVRGDFVISPNAPTFVAPGDTFTVTANIANTSQDQGPVEPTQVTLSTSPGLSIVGPSQQSVLIAKGQERPVAFTLKANALLGNADLQFSAKTGVHSVQYGTTLSVRPASAYQTTLISGSDQAGRKIVDITRELYPQYRIAQAMASTNPLILAQGLKGYLQAYPYNCTEQVVSTALAQLAIAEQPLFQSDAPTMRQTLATLLQLLRQRLNDQGGFSYWPGQSGDDAMSRFSTVYAMDFLTEAKLRGYAVPADLMENGLRYLQNLAKQEVEDLPAARLQAYAIYILTRNEIVTTAYLTHLQLYLNQQQDKSWQNDMTSVYLAATYKLLKNEVEATRLLSHFALGKQAAGADDPFNNALITKAQYFVLLGRHFPQRLQESGSAVMVDLAQGISGNELNTLSAAYSALALSTYAQTIAKPADNKLTIAEMDAHKMATPLVAPDPDLMRVNFSSRAKQIEFNNLDKLLYFYQIQQSGFNSINPTQPDNKGIEVYREYRDTAHAVITQANLGDEIESHIRIRSLTDSGNNNVAIVDLLPGGFDVVRSSVKQGDCDYVDVREDRVIFYCPVNSDAMELSYHLKAVNQGSFVTAPILAQDMYKPSVQSTGVAGKMIVK